mgnify:CR=1 FL=1
MSEHECTDTRASDLVGVLLAAALGLPNCDYTELWEYARLVIATDHDVDRAIVYLKDTRSPVHAKGRLLLRAAERALRTAGDIE